MSLALAARMNAQATHASFPLSIAGRAGHKFTPPTMVQGFVCHARGVEIQQSSRTRVVARVRSKRVYDVDLRAVNGRLVVGCKCPARSFGLEVCKHAWAALLEIDRKGGLEALREDIGTLAVEAAPSSEGEIVAPDALSVSEPSALPDIKPSRKKAKARQAAPDPVASAKKESSEPSETPSSAPAKTPVPGKTPRAKPSAANAPAKVPTDDRSPASTPLAKAMKTAPSAKRTPAPQKSAKPAKSAKPVPPSKTVKRAKR